MKTQAVEMLYANPELDINNLCPDDVSKFNNASSKLHYKTFLKQLGELDLDVNEFIDKIKMIGICPTNIKIWILQNIH